MSFVVEVMQMNSHVVLKALLSVLIGMQKGTIWKEMKPPSGGFIHFAISLFWYGQHCGFGVHQLWMSVGHFQMHLTDHPNSSWLKQRACGRSLSHVSPTSGLSRWLSLAGFPPPLSSRSSLQNHNWGTRSQDRDFRMGGHKNSQMSLELKQLILLTGLTKISNLPTSFNIPISINIFQANITPLTGSCLPSVLIHHF